VLFVGVDWGERHHDLCLLDQDGSVLATRRIAECQPSSGAAGPGEPAGGILHGCLAHRVVYQEQVAWPAAESAA
jgi:hypothetical protein